MDTASIPLSEFQQIPFYAGLTDPSRVIPTLTFFGAGEWHMWFAAGRNVVKIKGQPVEAHYFGDRPERDTDQCVPLLDLIAQRAMFPEVLRPYRGLWNDYQSLAASLAKLRLFHRVRKEFEVRRFVQTELEYIILVCRSFFDLLQEIVAAMWLRIVLPGGAVKKELKRHSFADIVASSGKPLTAEQIRAKYGLLPRFAEWYASHAQFFLGLRAFRDRIAHSGEDAVKFLYVTERGFGIHHDLKPFCDLYTWPPECELPNRLVPLRPVIAKVVLSAFEACDSFTRALTDSVRLPEEMAPGMRFYSRGLHDAELFELREVVEKSLW